MFVHIKAKMANPLMPVSGFTLDQIMLSHNNFHKLTFTWVSSYIELSDWITNGDD